MIAPARWALDGGVAGIGRKPQSPARSCWVRKRRMGRFPCLPRCLALLLALVFGGVLAGLAPGPGGPGRVGAQVPGTVLWGATGGNTAGQLYRIDPTNGASTLVGNLAVGGTPIEVTRLAVDPTTNVLYGATSNASPNFPVSLVTIDKTSAAATLVGPMGLTNSTADLSFRSDGTLLGVTFFTNGTAQLVTVNKSTGAATPVSASTVPGVCGGGLSFVPLTSSAATLYASLNADNGSLTTLNPTTAAASGSVPLQGTAGRPIAALTTDPAGTVLLGVRLDSLGQQACGGGATQAAELLAINPSNGAVTKRGDLPARLDALALDLQPPP